MTFAKLLRGDIHKTLWWDNEEINKNEGEAAYDKITEKLTDGPKVSEPPPQKLWPAP